MIEALSVSSTSLSSRKPRQSFLAKSSFFIPISGHGGQSINLSSINCQPRLFIIREKRENLIQERLTNLLYRFLPIIFCKMNPGPVLLGTIMRITLFVILSSSVRKLSRFCTNQRAEKFQLISNSLSSVGRDKKFSEYKRLTGNLHSFHSFSIITSRSLLSSISVISLPSLAIFILLIPEIPVKPKSGASRTFCISYF